MEVLTFCTNPSLFFAKSFAASELYQHAPLRIVSRSRGGITFIERIIGVSTISVHVLNDCSGIEDSRLEEEELESNHDGSEVQNLYISTTCSVTILRRDGTLGT